MGALFAIFSSSELKDFELKWKDIEESHPADAAVYEKSRAIVEKLKSMTEQMENYGSCGDLIKAAIAADTDSEEQKQAIRAAMIELSERASKLLDWMRSSEEIGRFLSDVLLPQLALRIEDDDTHLDADKSPAVDVDFDDEKKSAAPPSTLTTTTTSSSTSAPSASAASSSSSSSSTTLEVATSLSVLTHQALSRQAVAILELLLSFDQAKMLQSQLQNDFAYYKRNLAKAEESYLSDVHFEVTTAEAGNISMFMAYSIPSLRAVAQVIKENELSTHTLAVIANACYDLLKAKKFPDGCDDHKTVVRAMVAAFVMFDFADTIGAFTRRSATKGTKICSMIQSGYESTYGTADPILGVKNTIMFSTLHYNDDTTVAAIRRTLDP